MRRILGNLIQAVRARKQAEAGGDETDDGQLGVGARLRPKPTPGSGSVALEHHHAKRSQYGGDAPLVITGPGGSYTREWPARGKEGGAS